MKYLAFTAILISICAITLSVVSLQKNAVLGSSITTTASSDTLETFRVNVNASLSSLQNDRVSTTTTQTFTALQSFFGGASTTAMSANYLQVGGTATSTLNTDGSISSGATTTVSSVLGIASTSPYAKLSIGTTGATSTIMGGYFCAYFKDEAGRGMWVKLATSGNTVFSTSTSACQ